jgi:hypothetical protein
MNRKRISVGLLTGLLFLFVISFSAIPAHAVAPTISSSTGTTCASSPCTTAGTVSATSGDLIIITVLAYHSGAVAYTGSTVTVSAGWTMTNVIQRTATGSGIGVDSEIWYGTAASTTTSTASVTTSQTSAQVSIWIADISNSLTSAPTGFSGSQTNSNCVTTPTASVDATVLLISACTHGAGKMNSGTESSVVWTNNFGCNSTSIFAGCSSHGVPSGITTSKFPVNAVGSSIWADTGIVISSLTTSILPVKCTMDNSATQATLAISGGSPSPSPATVLCDGSVHNIAVAPSTTITFTEPADGANTRDRFSGGATTTTDMSCGSGTCTEFDITNYEELQNTYQMTPVTPSTWDAAYSEAVTGTLTGTGSTTICTISLSNGGGAASCTNWADYNRVVTVVASFASSVSGTWTSVAPNTFTQTTGGNTNNVNYNLLAVAFTITCTMDNSGSPQATVVLSGGSVSPGTVLCDGSGHSFTANSGATITATEPSDGATTRYRFASGVLFITHGVSAWSFTNYLQLKNTYVMTPDTPPLWDDNYAESVTGTFAGTGSSTICTNNMISNFGTVQCTGWADYNRAATAPFSFPSTVSGTWTAVGANSFMDTTGGNTNTVIYNNIIVFPPGVGITCTMDNGAAAVNVTLTGAGISPGIILCDGISHPFTVISVSIINATEPADSANIRYRFNLLDNESMVLYRLSSDTPWSFINYEQLENTYQASPIVNTVNQWDGVFNITYSGLGVGIQRPQNLTTINGGGTVANTTQWYDNNRPDTFTTTDIIVSVGERWFALPPFTFTQTTANNTNNVDYYDQLNNTYRATPLTPSTWDAGYHIAVTGTFQGTNDSTICVIIAHTGGGAASCPDWSDKNLTVSLPVGFGAWVALGNHSFIDDPGNNTHNVDYVRSETTVTRTVIGWNVPDAPHFDNALILFLLPLFFFSLLGLLPLLFDYKGDFVVTLGLTGLLGGAVIGTLAISDVPSISVPFAIIGVGAVLLILWLWKGAKG